jgi:hypothetical protein
VSHEISFAVWDLPSPVVSGWQTRMKVGISCPSSCPLSGTTIDIHDETGATIASGRVGSEPWPDTLALYWVELDVAAPETEGTHAWSIHATPPDAPHILLDGLVRVFVSKPPEHRLTIDVIEQGSGLSLGDVELRVGAFRATTNEDGRAHVEVPEGTYDVHAWKLGYDLLSSTASVAADTTMQLEVAPTPQTEQPYWM